MRITWDSRRVVHQDDFGDGRGIVCRPRLRILAEEGRRRFEESLARMRRQGGEPDARVQARALNAGGFLALIQGGTEQALVTFEKSLEFSQQHGDRYGIVRSLNNLMDSQDG